MKRPGVEISASFRRIFVALGIWLSFAQLTTPVFAQDIDSLKQRLKEVKTYERQFEIQQLLAYSYEGGNKASLQATCEMVRIATLVNKDSMKKVAYFTYGAACEENADFKGSILFFFKGLAIAEKLNDTVYICHTLNYLGIVYKQLFNGPQALYYLNQAEKFTASEKIEAFMPSAISSNKAEIYLFMGKPDSARKYLDKARKGLRLAFHPAGHSRMFSIEGDIFLKTGELQKAERAYAAGIRVADSLKQDIHYIQSLNGYAEVLCKLNKPNQAKDVALLSLNVHKKRFTRQVGTLSIYITGLLSRIYKNLGQYDSAYYFSELNNSYRDSILNSQNISDIEGLAFSQKVSGMEEEQKEKDQQAEQNIQKQTHIRNGLLAGTLVLIIIFGLLIYQTRLKRKIEMERMRNRLSRDLHDDIGSTLSSINILSKVAKKTVEKNKRERAIESLEKINERSQRLLLNMSDLVWKMNPANDTLEEVMSRMQEYAVSILEAKDIQFTLDFPKDHPGMKLPMEVKNNLYLIFKEAVNNLAKYADCSQTTLVLVLEKSSLRLEIWDNGKGFDEESLSHKGGLINMKMRAEEMKASLKITSESGKETKVVLEMKV